MKILVTFKLFSEKVCMEQNHLYGHLQTFFRKLTFFSNSIFIRSKVSNYRGFQIRIFGQKGRSNQDSNPNRSQNRLRNMDPCSLTWKGGNIRRTGNMIQMKYVPLSFHRPMRRRLLKRRRRDEVEKRIRYQNMGYYWIVSNSMVKHLWMFHPMPSWTNNHR